MNTSTGILMSPSEFAAFPESAKAGFIEVKRDLTRKEELEMQIRLYAPCACGSGKKFKFCCKTKP